MLQAQQSPLTLSTLPAELLFNISIYLDAPSALSLSTTCRTCHDVVYNSTVFRHILEGSNASWESAWVTDSLNLKDIVKRRGDDAAVLARYNVYTSSRRNLWGRDEELASTLRKRLGRTGDGWIRYSFANDKAFSTFMNLDDLLDDRRKARQVHMSFNTDQLLEYLPQLVLLKHPSLHSPSTVPLLMTQIEKASQAGDTVDIDTRLAFSYCGSILSHSEPLEAISSDSSSARKRLERFAFQRMTAIQKKLKASAEPRITQSDGQLLLGSLSALLRLAFRNYRVSNLMGAEYYTFLVPFFFDLPIFQEDSFNAIPLPFESHDADAHGHGRSFDGFTAKHIEMAMDGLDGSEWVGCYSYSKQGLEFESPMRQVTWNVTPSTKPGQYRVIATGSDTLGDFAFTGVGYADGNLKLRKTYMGGNAWDYTCILTPFGIVGVWGHVGLNTVRGAVWLWNSEWTS